MEKIQRQMPRVVGDEARSIVKQSFILLFLAVFLNSFSDSERLCLLLGVASGPFFPWAQFFVPVSKAFG